jgi:hypothetical protein|tara:strand:- start:30 stop:308 length:279 start_codon:yes stop_codon:yes gene_type:complete
MLITEQARTICSLIMRKALDIITIVTGILMLGILGGGFFTYKYLSSEQFKTKIMNSILGEVKGLLPNVLDKGLPNMTGPSIPTPPLQKELKF